VRLRELNTELEHRVRQRTAALEEANRELEAFSYSIAHDLRAPLRGINGFSELLMERHAGQLSPEALSYLTRVRNAATRMSQLIDALLSLARIGNAELQPLDCDLSELAHSLILELAASHPDRRVTARVQPGMRAHADPRLLRSALCNLLDNAWKFTSHRDKAQVEVGACSGTAVPTFYVRDNGAGFDPAYSDKLFGPFQRLHTEREFPGTGIGLAVVHRVIKRHGGEVCAEARPDEGATFYFSLPTANVS
jgi:light-regulated signal transduction histidine kinase (bacteriophytochrome)